MNPPQVYMCFLHDYSLSIPGAHATELLLCSRARFQWTQGKGPGQ